MTAKTLRKSASRTGRTRKAPAPRRARKLDRPATEARLIRAFDAVLQRSGVQGLKVNAVVEEAGIGKALLYRYFGDLNGLATAWGATYRFLPTQAEVHARDLTTHAGPSVRLARVLVAYAEALRSRPATRELLASELMRPNAVTAALSEVRAKFGRESRDLLTDRAADLGAAAYPLAFLLTAATTYLALRSKTQPDYYGANLDDPQTWLKIEAMIEKVARRVLAAPTL